jgi:hypothetical protein
LNISPCGFAARGQNHTIRLPLDVTDDICYSMRYGESGLICRRKEDHPMVAALLSALFFSLLLYYIAGKRGANRKFWLVMGLVFGIFALPFVFFAKTDRHFRQQKRHDRKAFDRNETT